MSRWFSINVIIAVCLLAPAISQHVPSTHTSNARTFTIAVIDTGIDVHHTFIADNIWINPGETGVDGLGQSKHNNGIDDDKNGFVDDVHGWNFIKNNKDIRDFDGHGTHIAGSIKKTIYRENPYAPFKLMPLKYYSSGVEGNHKRAFLKALAYAIDARVDIINVSGGGRSFEKQEYELLQKARDRGIIVVAAAGNKAKDKGYDEFFPAAYNLTNIVSVAATDEAGNLLATSNLNEYRENVFVPGQKIMSALPENKFGFKTGSSQAAAIYTGHYVATRASAR